MIHLTNELSKILKPHGFTRRGSAFFRVHGDGVLQLVKFARERETAELRIGLFSMYSELKPQWFTSLGCIPRYQVQNVIGKRWVGVFRYEPSYKDSLVAQLETMRDEGILWLNQITTQKQLSKGIHYLETGWVGCYRWNDLFKTAPYLACGEFDNAYHTVQAILDQHEMAYRTNKAMFSTEEAYQEYLKPRVEKDKELYDLLAMIGRKDNSEIQQYLLKNYDKNVSYAGFCMK